MGDPRRIEEIWLHCSATQWGDVLTFDAWHRARGWGRTGGVACGYQFVVLNGRPNAGTKYWPFLDGQIQPGRPLDDDPIFEDHEVGAHVAGRNSRSLGICLVGDDHFTDAQLEAARALIGQLGTKFHVPVPSKVFGHAEDPDTSKTCPNIPMDVFRGYLDYSKNLVDLQLAIFEHNAALRAR